MTEALEDCSCSVARECFVTQENLYGMDSFRDEEMCRRLCFDSSVFNTSTRCEFYNYYDTSHPTR